MTAATSSPRARNLDQLRAVAALAVVAGHAYGLGGRVLPIQGEHWYDALLLQTGTGVWLFFAISGFVITRPFLAALVRGEPLPRMLPYAVRRVLRIYPIYWVALAATVVVVGDAVGPRRLLLHGALLHNLVPGRQQAVLSVAWTLTLEVLFYISVPILAVLARRRWGPAPISADRIAAVVVASWITSAVWTALAAAISDPVIGVWGRMVFPAMWSSFCPGILLALLSVSGGGAPSARLSTVSAVLARPARAAAVVVPCLACAAWWGVKAPSLVGERSYLVLYDLARQLFAVGYGVLIGLAIRAKPWDGRIGRGLGQVGEMSYGVYLFHAVLIYALLAGHGPLVLPLGSGLPGYLAHLGAVLALTLPVAWLSWRFLEQPMIRWATAFSARRSVQPVAAPAVNLAEG